MAWVIDTCILLDVLDADPRFGRASAAGIDRRRGAGLTVCPVTLIEMAPAFLGEWRRAVEFLTQLGVDLQSGWTSADTRAAFSAWHRQVEHKRAGRSPRRPVADIQIGAYALRHTGLLTRKVADFQALFPTLKVEEP